MKNYQPLKRLFLSLLLSGFLTPLAWAQVTKIENEGELIAIINSENSDADKAMACKRLAIYGSEKCVPTVAKLLGNEQLSSWARITLEALPGKASNEALRNAAKNLNGRVLVGVINSLGVRRDAEAVEILMPKLQDKDTDVASAAAVALGAIGNSQATDALKKAMTTVAEGVRSSVAEGLILSAERSYKEGRLTPAMELYDLVRKANVPQQRVVEGTRGAILSRKTNGIPLLLEELRANEYFRFQLGLRVARELDGVEVDKALAEELSKAKPERAALLITAMADRQKTVDVKAILQALGAEAKPVRLAAAKALGSVGNLSCVDALLKVAKSSDTELIDAAVMALSQIPDESVDADVAKRLSSAEGATLIMLIRAAGERGVAANDSVIKALENADAAVRNAAFTALGDTLPAEKLSVLIGQYLTPKFQEDKDIAFKSLMTASIRMPDREACATELTKAYAKGSTEAKVKLLEILGAVGGTKALNSVSEAAMSTEEAIKDSATKVLGSWMTIDAAPVLLNLTEKLPLDKYQVRAVRAYLRIARQFDMQPAQRLEMAKTALTIAKQPEEKKLVLDALKRIPNLDSLAMAVSMASIEEIKTEAIAAANDIAGKIKDQKDKVQEVLSKLPK
jgi:HEAT repeat protein